jgi:hypothetical protein
MSKYMDLIKCYAILPNHRTLYILPASIVINISLIYLLNADDIEL